MVSLSPSSFRAFVSEIDRFARRPEKFAIFALDARILRTAVTLIAEILKRVTQVEKFILEEEVRFASFSRWVRYGTSSLLPNVTLCSSRTRLLTTCCE